MFVASCSDEVQKPNLSERLRYQVPSREGPSGTDLTLAQKGAKVGIIFHAQPKDPDVWAKMHWSSSRRTGGRFAEPGSTFPFSEAKGSVRHNGWL
jgi:hypothetical protein